MAMSEVKEPPPKPTRIRTSTSSSAKSEQANTIPGTMINGQQSPISKTPTPIPRLTHRTAAQGANSAATVAAEQLEVQNDSEERNADIKAKRSALLSNVSGIASRAIAPTLPPTNQNINNIPISNNHVSRAALPRASAAPAPPPKPKRISLAPQPKAKPLSLQSIPLLPKETPVRPLASSAPTAVAPPPPPALSSPPPITPNRIPNTTQSSEVFRSKVNPNSVLTSPTHPATPPPKKPRSTEHSMDVSLNPVDSASAQQRFKNQMKAQPSSPPPSMSKSNPNIGTKPLFDYSTADKRTDATAGTNPTLVGARSRLRSTSDAKASTSLAVAVSQTTRSFASNPHALDDNDGFNFIEHNRGYISPLVSPTHAPSHLGNSGLYDDDMGENHSAAAAEKLTASLHKIQALAQGQTERMKQINYAEKKADLAEVVYEKSNLWRARGAEWGGIAKKAWEDRGGMGGIAGGLADRWKKRGDSGNDGMLDYSRHGPAAQIFGLPLEDAVRLSKISASTGVPAVITRCIEYLDIMGVEEVGLYRVSGSTTNVAKLKAIFDNGNKGYTAVVILNFNGIDFSDSKHQPIQRLKDALHHLPLENYILLGTLCQHLSNLADYESCTKMNISNLGLIFCPTLQIGSVLFKNLLGGDGNEVERRKCLLIVWTDLDGKREEMENLEMIKSFEQGLQLDGNGAASNPGTEDHGWEERNENGRQSWEEVDRDLINFSSSPPQPSTSASQSYHPKGSSGSKFGGTFATLNKTKTEPPLDLYDELMTRELNEATNTPLIDLGLDDEPDTHQQQQDGRWRRHAREPATNRRSKSPSPQPLNVARHERYPAVSIR
ncbi:hypothetical protein BGX26_004878 [Mortierella sp. AD094]|nr:hypothetical protein BGX26_004878 [Mortierella sp. AD094]